MKTSDIWMLRLENAGLKMKYRKIWFYSRSIPLLDASFNACLISGKFFQNTLFVSDSNKLFPHFSYSECKCIPWDMVRPDNFNPELCDSIGNLCFYSKMRNVTYQRNSCKCQPLCNVKKFTTTETISPLETTSKCKVGNNRNRFLLNFVFPRIPQSKIIETNIKDLKGGVLIPPEYFYEQEYAKNVCPKKILENMAIIQVKVIDSSYVKMRQSLRTSFGEKIGVLGGTLGLFTGFSVMVLVEIAYWIIIMGKSILKNQWI